MTNKSILITGASRGIGRAIALELSKNNNSIILLARDDNKLKELKNQVESNGSKCLAIKCDVSLKDDVRQAVAEIVECFGSIDIAFLNAGIGMPNYLCEFDSQIFENIFKVNVFGIAYFLEFIIPVMKKQGSGIIVGTSSLADARGLPGSAAYSSSKIAVSHLLEAARIELKGLNIDVITLKPGFVKTDLIAKNTFYMPFLMEAEDAAKRIIKDITNNKKRIYFPLPIAILNYLGKIIPSIIYENIIKFRKKSMIED